MPTGYAAGLGSNATEALYERWWKLNPCLLVLAQMKEVGNAEPCHTKKRSHLQCYNKGKPELLHCSGSCTMKQFQLQKLTMSFVSSVPNSSSIAETEAFKNGRSVVIFKISVKLLGKENKAVSIQPGNQWKRSHRQNQFLSMKTNNSKHHLSDDSWTATGPVFAERCTLSQIVPWPAPNVTDNEVMPMPSFCIVFCFNMSSDVFLNNKQTISSIICVVIPKLQPALCWPKGVQMSQIVQWPAPDVTEKRCQHPLFALFFASTNPLMCLWTTNKPFQASSAWRFQSCNLPFVGQKVCKFLKLPNDQPMMSLRSDANTLFLHCLLLQQILWCVCKWNEKTCKHHLCGDSKAATRSVLAKWWTFSQIVQWSAPDVSQNDTSAIFFSLFLASLDPAVCQWPKKCHSKSHLFGDSEASAKSLLAQGRRRCRKLKTH